MSVAQGREFLLSTLEASSTLLFTVHLAHPAMSWTDGQDAAGNAVLLVGGGALRKLPDGAEGVRMILADLAAGVMPPAVGGIERVRGVAYAPQASLAYAKILDLDGPRELLAWGVRGSGKTYLAPGALLGLAELHHRAGYPLPLRALWLHDSGVNARSKTLRTLQEETWAPVWSVRDGGAVAVATIAGVEYVVADIVPTTDLTSAERLRAAAHCIVGEELIASLDDGGGISERAWEMAWSSTTGRLPGRKRVALGCTNPGDPTSWPHTRFLEGGGREGCEAIEIAADDRMSEAEQAALKTSFTGSPDLHARLALGQWTALRLGEVVAVGYDAAIHIARSPMRPSPEYVLALGWDGGHSPSCVIAQLIHGQVRVFAALNDLKVGVEELIIDQVVPWLISYAPWIRERGGTRLLQHVIDPSMKTGAEATIRISSERTILDTLGGRMAYGAQLWPPRREAILRVLAPHHEGGVVPLAINPTSDTTLLRMAYSSRWFYAQSPDGRVDRSRPKKPNSPFADVGDASAYLFGWLVPGAVKPPKPKDWRPPKSVGVGFSPLAYMGHVGRRR